MDMSVALSGRLFNRALPDAQDQTAATAGVVPQPTVTPMLSGASNAERHPFAACVMTDAQHFTEATEGMDPCEVVELVKVYFDALFAPVIQHGGRVIDVQGDGILAVWTDSSSPAELRNRVCTACLEMAEAVDDFNAAHPMHRLPTRIGVDVGLIALANLGSLACLQHRAMGDPVITASRLEQLNKELKTSILVSSALAEGEAAHVFRNLGSFRLRGQRNETRVLELVNRRGALTQRQRSLCDEFAPAIAAYQAGDRERAATLFRRLRLKYPGDGPTRFFAERCTDHHERRFHLDLQRIAARAGLSYS